MEIQIPRQVYAKVMHWINKSNDEVSGFGRATYHKETGVLWVHDAYLIKQRNGAAHTDIDGQSLAKLMFKTKDLEGELKWWWHSHVNMAVFWSGTDTATIKELASQGWMAATVFNKKEETRSALGYLTSTELFGSEVVIKDSLETYIIDIEDDEVKKSWDKEYDDNIDKSTPAAWPRSMYSGYDDPYESQRFNSSYGIGGVSYGPGGVSLLDSDFRTIETKVLTKAQKEDKAYYLQFGWTGAGAYEEAKVLKMPVDKWIDMLMKSEVRLYDQYDQLLDQAIAIGQITPRKDYE